jgi:two-component system phosphate regulon sensor histidine kinase PhoR
MEPGRLTYNELLSEIDELRFQLDEANDTIDAIRTGQVDALIVQGEDGNQLYTLKTADQTYRTFIEKMNEGAITVNKEGTILYSNSRFAAMLGLSLEKVIGLPFNSFVGEQSKQKFGNMVASSWDKESKEEMELITKKQQLIPCLLSCNKLELAEGTTLSLIITDLTKQKDTEKQLKVNNEQLMLAQNATEKLNDELEDTVRSRTADLLISREHFKLLSDNIPQMSWTNFPDGRINFYNQQWYQYTGLTFEESKDFGWKAVIHPDDLAATIENYKAALQLGGIFEVENRYKRTDGIYRWHLNRAIPLHNNAGEIIYWVGTATDIEDQVREMERRDEFISIASHELKTPLTSLKGYLQLMGYKKDDLSPVIRQYVDKASISLNKLQTLINDLLDVSKIQAGKLEYMVAPFNLSGMIQLCLEDAHLNYPLYEFEGEDATEFLVNGNEERLEQVFMNMISNAVKYSPVNKKITIQIAKHGNGVRVSVTDKGVGLSETQIEHVFERFYRVEDKKYMSGGLGMGLYISQQIILNHQGKIGVESELGHGSTFYFDLPLIENIT